MIGLITLFEKVTNCLTFLEGKINLENAINDHGLNVHLEAPFLNIYNIINNSNLRKKGQRTEGYDGIDEDKKLIAQVTTNQSIEKVLDTIYKVPIHILNSRQYRLIFIVLGSKKRKNFAPKSIDKINKSIGNNLMFDYKTDIIYFEDILKQLDNEGDIVKIKSVLQILEEVLGYIPYGKETNFESIGISFDDKEIINVIPVVCSLLKNNLNVYTSSKVLYDKIRINHYNLFSHLIYTSENKYIQHIKYNIVILSNDFISLNFKTTNTPRCILLQHAINNETKIYSYSFDPYLLDLKLLKNTPLYSYETIQAHTIDRKIEKLVGQLFAEEVYGNYSVDEIGDALIHSFNTFHSNIIDNNREYLLLNFYMPEHSELVLNYLILKKDSTNQLAYKYFSEYHSRKYSKSLTVLVFKNFSHKTRRKLELVKGSFNISSVFYVDEHLFNKSLTAIVQNPILAIEDFVPPIFMLDKEHLRINDIINWIINNNDSTIGIVKAGGGIGKTTISAKIHDILITDYKNYIVIFIDSHKYIEQFGGAFSGNSAEYDLYAIFESCHSYGKSISKNTFYLNLSLGNIVIIFDGVDEIISTVTSFNLITFLNNIKSIESKIGNGKILLNCRDTYIDDFEKYFESKHIPKIQKYELLGFNQELVDSYFKFHFDNVSKVKTCNKLLHEFYLDIKGSEYKYYPFILEIIVDIVKANFAYDKIDSSFTSSLLNQNDNNEYLIYRVLNREMVIKEKKGFSITVDEQVKFMCEFAIEEKGAIDYNSFDIVLNNIGLKDRIDQIMQGLKDHPLLINKETYRFRFDFFNPFFKSVFLFNMIYSNINAKRTKRFIEVIAKECNYNSVIAKTIINKIVLKKNMELLLVSTRTLIEEITNDIHTGLYDSTLGMQSISNLFTIILRAANQLNIKGRDILVKLFEIENNCIKNFYWRDIPYESSVELDLSGLYFENANIFNVPGILNCQFDDTTYFDESCEINMVLSKHLNLKKLSLSSGNFDKNIKGDNSLYRVLKYLDLKDLDLGTYFRRYLSSFYIQKDLQRSININKLAVFNELLFDMNELLRVLMDFNVITKLDENNIYINMGFHSKLNKFIFQGLPFLEINNAILELKERLSGLK